MGRNASGEGVQSPLPGAQRTRAIAALLPGSAQAAAVGRFEALLATRNCPPEALKWMQPPGGSPLAAVVVPSPGGVGMLVASPLPGPGAAAGLTSVTRAALTAGLHQGLHFVQVLLQLDDDLRHTCMVKAGFRPLATLHTMTRGLLPRLVPDLRTRHAPAATTDVQLVPCLQLPAARVAAPQCCK